MPYETRGESNSYYGGGPPPGQGGGYGGDQGGYGGGGGPPPGGYGGDQGDAYRGDGHKEKEKKSGSNTGMMMAAGAGGLAVGAIGGAIIAHELSKSIRLLLRSENPSTPFQPPHEKELFLH